MSVPLTVTVTEETVNAQKRAVLNNNVIWVHARIIVREQQTDEKSWFKGWFVVKALYRQLSIWTSVTWPR